MSFWQGVEWRIQCQILNVCFDFLSQQAPLKYFEGSQILKFGRG